MDTSWPVMAIATRHMLAGAALLLAVAVGGAVSSAGRPADPQPLTIHLRMVELPE